MKKIRKEVSRCTSWVEFSELRELFSVAVISWIRSDSKILLLELYKNFDGKQVKSRHIYVLLSENQNRLFPNL